ncbi:hypothetical protein V9T40_010864 [Parthenolecanium corni]|uniref:Uncharacterized protein n=1 Tax=Parthenolecanium corni TaxID=536013 RepID=A0AAN9XYX6_9HEMI
MLYLLSVQLWHESMRLSDWCTTVAELSPTVGFATIGHYFFTMSESDCGINKSVSRTRLIGVLLWQNLVRQSDLPQLDIISVLCRSPIVAYTSPSVAHD